MYILINGEDTFRSRAHLQKMIASFKEKRDPQGLNVSILDCAKAKPEDIWEQLGTVPFLAEKRMVVLKELLGRKDDELLDALREKLEAGAFAETAVIVFFETTSEFKKNKLFDFLKKQPYSTAFPLMKEFEREVWVKRAIQARNGSITTGAARTLAAAVEETWQLEQVVEQACALAGAEEIQRAHVEPFVEPPLDDNIFNFTDALAAGNTRRALELLRDQRRADANEFYLLTMITRQFRILMQIHDRASGDAQGDIAKELGVHPYVIQKSLPLAKRYSFAQLKTIYDNLFKIETLLKTTATPADALLDQFVVTSTQ
ncbi:MAG: DNA polymerase III subunit delta [Patescibacteria group bacterium]